MKRYLSAAQAAEYLGIQRSAFQRRLRLYTLEPDVMVGDRQGYTQDTLDAWDKTIPKRGTYPRKPRSFTTRQTDQG
ncbi:hypothetical protein [Kocuria massiliensis]|uniref:hypothetical protein n=1 Tax=Kocuria massiliensis TaxID=1926282 RepID=UPI000A1CABC7|nr:hypothetical protein [Kocuria massiliensis]